MRTNGEMISRNNQENRDISYKMIYKCLQMIVTLRNCRILMLEETSEAAYSSYFQ